MWHRPAIPRVHYYKGPLFQRSAIPRREGGQGTEREVGRDGQMEKYQRTEEEEEVGGTKDRAGRDAWEIIYSMERLPISFCVQVTSSIFYLILA